MTSCTEDDPADDHERDLYGGDDDGELSLELQLADIDLHPDGEHQHDQTEGREDLDDLVRVVADVGVVSDDYPGDEETDQGGEPELVQQDGYE